MKRGAPDHPKMFALAEALGVRRPMAVGLIEMLIHFTAQYAPRGDIGRYDDKRIAAGLDWPGNPQKLIDALVATRWVDRHAVARLVVHDWSDHADRSTVQRLTRNGETMIKPFQRRRKKVCTQSDTDTRTCQPTIQPTKPVPVPEPVPNQPTNPPSVVEASPEEAALVGGLVGPSPLTAVAIRTHFPAVEDPFVAEIVTIAMKTSPGRAGPVTDELIAAAVEASYDSSQRSAGRFKKSVPRVLTTWAEQGRATSKPPPDKNQIRRENTNKFIKALQR